MKHSWKEPFVCGSWLVVALLSMVVACEPGEVVDDEDEGSSSGAGASGSTAATTTTGGQAGLTCAELWECYAGCSDSACGQACYDQGSPEAKAQDDALYACLVSYGCQDFPCVEQNCPNEYQACFGTPPQTSGSTSSTTTTGSGGQTWWKCTAEGAYTCCQDGICNDYPVSQFDFDTDQNSAALKAQEGCSNQVTSQIIICNINGQGSWKYSCEVVSCEPT